MAQQIDSLLFHLWQWGSTQHRSLEKMSFMMLTSPNFVYWHLGSNHNPGMLAAFPYKSGTSHICTIKHMISARDII